MLVVRGISGAIEMYIWYTCRLIDKFTLLVLSLILLIWTHYTFTGFGLVYIPLYL